MIIIIFVRNFMKDFDAFSFKPKTHKGSEQSLSSQAQRQIEPVPQKNWKEMSYRFEKDKPKVHQPLVMNKSKYLNEKIQKMEEELSQNIRRRLQLQKKMEGEKQQKRQLENEAFFKEKHIQPTDSMAKKYATMQKKSDYVENMLRRSELRISQMQREEQQLKRKKQKQPSPQRISKEAPCQIQVQKLMKKVTFPEFPKQSLISLEKQCLALSYNFDHSDLVYLLMVIYFHLGNYAKVRQYYRQILMYKLFQPKAYWVACQAEFQLDNYDLCLKLSDKCMKQLSDKYLPRFIFLQARSYEGIGNFINSVVCYNQLIKLRPNVAQFYLERAVIYDKIGYPKEAKEDYTYFSILKSDYKEYLKDKILGEKEERKRKQLIQALAKMS